MNLTRLDIIKKILDLNGSDLDAEQASRIWFWDIRRNGGLRLTAGGYTAMKQAGIQSWSVPFERKSLDKKTMLEMNRRIQWPYFISTRPPELVLFSDTDAVMATLYGDVRSWLQNMESRH